MAFNYITAAEAAEMIHDGMTLGLSGFTAPGTPKAISEELAKKAEREHEAGRPFKINLFTGASTSDHVDGVLSRANAINMRAPYQNVPDLRKRINAHDCHYNDRHLSEMSQEMRYGFYGDIDFAIIEAADINDKGEIILGTGVGNIPTYAHMAKKIFIELNEELPSALHGMHDVIMLQDARRRGGEPRGAPLGRRGGAGGRVGPAKGGG
ncbi:MAG: acetyl-CoA hydrolase, partial [Muribaculaceae bacterium]|nr:acetyl-CoA hydrolase [Muribaculaceae bacterium]